MKYLITVRGCDDSTGITIELTDIEYGVVKKIADAVTKASEYGCMPKMYITNIENANEYDLWHSKDADNGFAPNRENDE